MSGRVADLAVIHGSGLEVLGDGSCEMTSGTRANIELGLILLEDGVVEQVICAGRGPIANAEYVNTEAGLMGKFLLQQGVDPSLFGLETRSTSTVGNWANSAPMITRRNAERVMGVADGLHIRRARQIGEFVAERSGFEIHGYMASRRPQGPKDYLKMPLTSGAEVLQRRLTARFLVTHAETPLDQLEREYDKFKGEISFAGISIADAKQFVHRHMSSGRAA